MANAKLVIEIITQAKDAVSGAKDAQSAFDGFQSGLGKMAAPAAAAGAAVVGIGLDFAKSASEMEQSMGGLDAVFGDSAGTMKQWAKDSAKNVGLSQTDYATLATKMGAQFKNMGQSTDEAADSTNKMIDLGADLAATYGGTTAEAVSALSAALRGEADPAERYGLALSQSAIKAELAADGADKLSGEAAKAAKTQAILKMATKQAGGAIGQYERELDSASGQTQQAQAAWANARAELGTALLPVLAAVQAMLAGVAGWMTQNKGAVLGLMAVIGGFAAAILAANVAMKAYQAAQVAIKIATQLWAAGQWLLNAAMSANPIGLVIAAVLLLVAGIVLLWKKSETFRTVVLAVWSAIATAAKAAWDAIKTAVTTVINAISGVIRRAGAIITGIWTAIKSAGSTAFNAIKAVVQTVVTWVQGAWRGAMGVITGLFNGIKGIASRAWNAVKEPVKMVLDWIKTTVKGAVEAVKQVWETLGAIATTAWDAIKTPIKAVVDWITDTWDDLVDAVGRIWDTISGVVETAIGGIKTMIDGIKQAWDDTVGAIGRTVETVKGWLSGIWDKLKSAAGAVAGVKPPGKSAPGGQVYYTAVPAGRGLSAGALGGPTRTAGGMGAGGTTINVYGALDADSVARQINGMLTARRRRVGPMLLGGALT